MKMSALDRILLLLTGLLAAYQIAVGIDGLSTQQVFCYTIGFGVLLVASLLLLILGFEALDSPIVVVVSTIIPLSISLGLVWEYLIAWRIPYLVFVIGGLLAILVTRMRQTSRLATVVLAVVHGIAGLLIFFLPIYLMFIGKKDPGFAMVGMGGGLIGFGGLLLSFLKMGKPILPRETILKVMPGLLLAMTAAYVIGFSLG